MTCGCERVCVLSYAVCKSLTEQGLNKAAGVAATSLHCSAVRCCLTERCSVPQLFFLQRQARAEAFFVQVPALGTNGKVSVA